MADDEARVVKCPFCEFDDYDSNILIQHIDLCHPEDRSTAAWPMTQHDTASQQDLDTNVIADEYVHCPHGCGEVVARAELPLHLDLHLAESLAIDDSGDYHAGKPHEYTEGSLYNKSIVFNDYPSNLPSSEEGQEENSKAVPSKGKQIMKFIRKRKHSRSTDSTDRETKRLGRAELGPYAHEKQMPSWLQKLLQSGANASHLNEIGTSGTLVKKTTAENESLHVIPVLMKLCRHDKEVERAFFCSSSVRHIFKMRREGGFCGYRNIQMLVSHIKDAQRPGHERFPGSRLPSILQLQDMIEQAWDLGFNSTGRIETGGIKGTRKYIGTPEAQALFSSLGIECDTGAFSAREGFRAHDILLQDVANYFRSGCALDSEERILQTDLAPIYFQHRGHSMTIIGFEISKKGTANLLVFDPMFKTSPAIRRLVQHYATPSDPGRILKAHRRGISYLQKYKDFEILKLYL